MLSFQQRLMKVNDALLGISGIQAYHYRKPANVKAPYVVWQESGADSFGSDNYSSERCIEGTIDIYSLHEFDPLFDSVPEALNGVANCRLNSVQYEDETKLIHYEYTFWC